MTNKGYKQYLRSDDWEYKRNLKTLNKSCCGICGRINRIQIHHLNYRDLCNIEQSDLRRLCPRCHIAAHKLISSGKIRFNSKNHNHRWNVLKRAVKKHLGLPKGEFKAKPRDTKTGTYYSYYTQVYAMDNYNSSHLESIGQELKNSI